MALYIFLGLVLLAVVIGIFALRSVLNSYLKKTEKLVEEKLVSSQQMLLSTHKDFLSALEGIYKDLGNLKYASQELLESTSAFENIFRRPMARGGLGEMILENLVKDILPPDKFKTQYVFRNGKKVDLAIFLPEGILCVDSKFTLDTFSNFVNSQGKEKPQQERIFVRSVKARIDETASYIIPQEKSLDFALMYVPSEQVYYEIISQRELLAYAEKKKVFMVSPTSFSLYLKTILLGFEGLRIEKEARLILDSIKQINADLEKLDSHFLVLGGHIKNSFTKYEETASVLGKLKGKMEGVLKHET